MTSIRPEGAPNTFVWDASTPVPWTCPYCNRPTTLTDNDVEKINHVHGVRTADGHFCFQVSLIVCPNVECKRTTATMLLRKWHQTSHGSYPTDVLRVWQLMPDSFALTFDAEVPDAITNDYKEACQILNLSPKASATLSRRCLQGMIRHFWGITDKTLKLEVDALKAKIDGTTWKAIDSVRRVGNIGAHMEKDVNVVIDVEPDEAQKLIGLIELLIYEWYVRTQDRERRVQEVIDLAENKKPLREPDSAIGTSDHE